VVRSLGKEINLNPPLTLGQLPDTPEELLKLDQVKTNNKFHRRYCKEKTFKYLPLFPNHKILFLLFTNECYLIRKLLKYLYDFCFTPQVFIKSELKVGVIYVKEGQYTEEEILDNNDNR
jgi:hypothetical protein